MGYFPTAILLAAMTALFMGIGYLVGGQSGMVVASSSNSAMSLITRMIHTINGATANEEVTRHSNCVLDDGSLHGR